MTQVLPRRAARAKPYLTLLLLIPALAALWIGWQRWSDVPVGGTVDAVKISTKHGFVGQAAEAVDNTKPETPDLYLQIFPKTGTKLVLPAFKDTPIGNGLTWNLPRAFGLNEIERIEVWDHNALLKDAFCDRITLDNVWESDGQRFHVQLQGKRYEPPQWAMATMIGGAVATLLLVGKFVWDQVV